MASIVPFEDTIDPSYVDCLTKLTAWPLIFTVKGDVEAVLSMGINFAFL